MERIGIHLELLGNYPWVYISTINGKKVKEKFRSEYGFVLGYTNKGFIFEDLTQIFNLIRKYR
jgi:hypothetical protein